MNEPFYTLPLWEPSEEERQRYIQKYGKRIVEDQYITRAKRLEILRDKENFPPAVVDDCYLLSRWMQPEILKEELQEIKEILNEIGIPYWMQFGCLLNQHRDGEVLFCNHDIDIGSKLNIKPEEEKNWKEILKKRFEPFEKRGFEVILYDKKRYIGQRVAVRKRTHTDLFLYEEFEKQYMFSSFKQFNDVQFWPKELFDNLKEMEFMGVKFNVPQDIEKCLELDYGDDWKTLFARKAPKNLRIIPLEDYKKLYPIKGDWRKDADKITLTDMEKEYKVEITK